MADRGGHVVVVGDAMVDVTVAHAGPISPDSDTPSAITVGGGGSAANTACWLGRQGRSVSLATAVGDDEFGWHVADGLAPFGVGFAATTHPGRTTGTCVVLVDAAGSRTMFPDRGANDALEPATVIDELADDPAWLHLSGYSLLGAGSRQAAVEGLEAAEAAAIPVSVDAASAAPLQAVGADAFLGWIDGIDLLFANEEEVDALGGPEAVLAHVAALVTKLGPGGARWTDGAATVTVAAVPATVVDTTGAGDAFAAGYLDALLAGHDPVDCLGAGAALAAEAVTVVGGRPPVPA